MRTATLDETREYLRIVPDLRAIESRLRAVSTPDAEALNKVIVEITGEESPNNRFYRGYRGVSRWL